MLKLTKLDENILSEAIEEWFNQNQININSNTHFWRRNPVGKIIKIKLKQLNKWKNGRRGKPGLNLTNNKSNLDW